MRIALVHWNEEEGARRAAALDRDGFAVELMPPDGAKAYRRIAADPPDCIVIDLSRLPSHGRDLALAIRERKRLRAIPLIFVDGDEEKMNRVRDAVFTTWRAIRGAVRKATANPPKNSEGPASRLAGYSGTPLPKKLGIKEGAVVALANAPDDFQQTLGALPAGATLRNGMRGRFDLLIWFPESAIDLSRSIPRIAKATPAGGTWICWPKKASGVVSDLSERAVREAGLAHGLVDYKIAAIDATWSGLKFALRSKKA